MVNLVFPKTMNPTPPPWETQVWNIYSGGLERDGSALGTHPIREEAGDRPATRWNPKVEVWRKSGLLCAFVLLISKYFWSFLSGWYSAGLCDRQRGRGKLIGKTVGKV